MIGLCITGCQSRKHEEVTDIKQPEGSEEETPTATETQRIICIDAGHQKEANTGLEAIGPGSSTMKTKVTGGTVGQYTGQKESVLNLKVALNVKELLELMGYKVVMTRTSQNVNISNIERAQIANNAHADICVRIHANGTTNPNVHGFFAITPSSKNPYLNRSVISHSKKLSRYILKYFGAVTKAQNHGLSYRDDLTGTNWCKMPVTLIEMGEMKNKEEDTKMATEEYQRKMAYGIAWGIHRYLSRYK